MYAVLLSAVNVLLGFLARSVIAKFFLYTALFFVVSEFLAVLIPKLPNGQALSSAFAGLPPSVWFFLDLVHADVGIASVLSAFVLRFIIRRLPIIG